MRRSLSVFLLVCICVLALPHTAQASFVDKIIDWFKPPVEQEGPRPDETLQAPFIQESAQKDSELMEIYTPVDAAASDQLDESQSEDIRKLSVAHRTDKQIMDWATNVTATALNFSLDELKKFGTVLRPSFSANGIQDFKSFLTRADIVRKLQGQKYKLASYISAQPQIVQKGQADGVWYWIVDVPVELNYLPLNVPNQARITPAGKQSGKIRLQITRTPNTKQFVQGMAVTRWTARELK